MLVHLKFFQLSIVNFSISLILDFYSIIFGFTVLTIRIRVCVFRLRYISSELNISRFYKLVFGFVTRIITLIFSSNLIFLIVGWDGLGILSFLLVIFYQNERSLASGLITFITNRVGDAFLLRIIILIRININWTLFNNIRFLILIILFRGSITKRAQIPFCVWLPRAMRAPTPISALVHSRTLVTAGVFLLIRLRENINIETLLVLGSLTSLIAGLARIIENDFKKIIALSTLRQLGVIFIRLGLNIEEVAFFHLCTHAFFKAIIFICAGDVINFNLGNQDIRLYGLIFFNNPIISIFLLIGNLALIGLPFLAGFYSKDAILEEFILFNFNIILILICWVGVLITSVYRTRIVILRMWQTNFRVNFYFKKNILIIYPLFILSIGAVISGSIISHFLYLELFIRNGMLKILPFFIIILGIITILKTWVKNLKSFTIITIIFLKPLTEHIRQFQSHSKIMILTREYGWLEVLPQKILSFITNIKTISYFISIIRILFLWVL